MAKGIAFDEDDLESVYDAAEAGCVEAQYRLGYCAYCGIGMVEDYKEAVAWLRKAAKQNHANAQDLLADCYAHGSGVRKNHAEAVRWWKKAAENGRYTTQKDLAICYRDGEYGFPRDLEQALTYAEMALANVDADGYDEDEAQWLLASIKEEMDGRQEDGMISAASFFD